MKNTSFRARTLACALLASTATCGLTATQAHAQTANQPFYRNLDANGVDLAHGDLVLNFIEGSIGSGDGALALVRTGTGNRSHQWDGIDLQLGTNSSGQKIVTVGFGPRWEQFTRNSDVAEANGSTLTAAGPNRYDHRTADGTLTVFGNPTGGTDTSSNFCTDTAIQSQCQMLPLSITTPDGKSVSILWDIWTDCSIQCTYSARISRISNSFGYSIDFSYASGGDSGSSGPPPTWFQRTGATFNNNASSSLEFGSVSYTYPEAGVVEVTDMAGRTWRVSSDAQGRVTGLRRPGAASNTTTIAYDGTTNRVVSVSDEGVSTSYARSVSGSTATMTVTNALNQQAVVTSDLNIGRPTSVRDALGRTRSFQYDSFGRLTRSTEPEGNFVQYSRDARGNITETREVGKPNSG
ncbi:MAG: RHS repeat protein, partial [Chloroflexi bacterium]|nr:RHS repeat protein [Chloroflexota bacterium]